MLTWSSTWTTVTKLDDGSKNICKFANAAVLLLLGLASPPPQQVCTRRLLCWHWQAVACLRLLLSFRQITSYSYQEWLKCSKTAPCPSQKGGTIRSHAFFAPVTSTYWPDDLDRLFELDLYPITMCLSAWIPIMNILGESFRKLEYYRQTGATKSIATAVVCWF